MDDMEMIKKKDEQQKTEETGVTAGFPANLWKNNRGVGVIEMVLILVILIGLVLAFKGQITAIVNNAFTAISGDAGQIIN